MPSGPHLKTEDPLFLPEHGPKQGLAHFFPHRRADPTATGGLRMSIADQLPQRIEQGISVALARRFLNDLHAHFLDDSKQKLNTGRDDGSELPLEASWEYRLDGGSQAGLGVGP